MFATSHHKHTRTLIATYWSTEHITNPTEWVKKAFSLIFVPLCREKDAQLDKNQSALQTYRHSEPNSLHPTKKRQNTSAVRFQVLLIHESSLGSSLTVTGVSAAWLRVGFPPLLRGADDSPQSTPEGFPPGTGTTPRM